MQTAIHFRDVHPDKSRIAAISAAIAFNGMLLMFLVAPMTAPPVVAELKEEWFPIVTEPVTPPPPPPPIEVPVTTQTQPAPAPIPAPAPAVEAPPVVDPMPGDTAAVEQPEVIPPTIPSTGGIVAPPDDGRPMEGAHLEYASAPPPAFPREALRDQLTGTVVLEVLVDVDGTPLDVKVSRSSGHRVLDAAARKQVLAKWKFRPAMRNGRAVQAIGVVPVEFRLDE